MLEGVRWECDRGGGGSFDLVDSSEETMAILGDLILSQTAYQDGDTICKNFPCSVWEKRDEHRDLGGVGRE